MGIFGKKKKTKEEDVQNEEVDEKVGQKKVFEKKDLKDLGSENKKSRREPKKPWGKYERYFVLIVILTTVGISAYLWFSSNGFSFKIPSLFNEETIIIENNN